MILLKNTVLGWERPPRCWPATNLRRSSTWTSRGGGVVNPWYWLVGLLPFEWAVPGTMYFMKNALLAVLVISPLFGLLSTMVVQSRMSFFSDAWATSAFTGMAIRGHCGLSRSHVVRGALRHSLRASLHPGAAQDQYGQRHGHRRLLLHRRGSGHLPGNTGRKSFTKFNNLLIGDILSVEPAKMPYWP